MHYTVVDENSGAIIGSVSSNVLYIPSGGDDSTTPQTHYFDFQTEQLQAKELMPVVVDGGVISEIPSTGTLEITGPLTHSGEIVVPSMTFTFDLPGTYTVTLTPDTPRWLPTTVEIIVPEEEPE